MVALGAALAAGGAEATPKEVSGRVWVVTRLEGQAVAGTVKSTVNFAPDGKASGATGCNRWFGVAVFAGPSLRVSQVGLTRMACEKPAMEREASFIRMLGLVRSWRVSGNVLILTGMNAEVVAELRAESGAGIAK